MYQICFKREESAKNEKGLIHNWTIFKNQQSLREDEGFVGSKTLSLKIIIILV
jgi:hypothetical protein